MNTKIAIAGIIVLIIAGTFFYYYPQEASPLATSTPVETSTTTPTVATSTPKGEGTLKGQMTIGPVCPVENIDNPCKPTPEMYAAAKVFVYKMDKKTLVKTITPDAEGHFSANLPAGEYFIDMIHQRIGGTTGVPTTVTIMSGKSVTLNLRVHTGLR